MAGVVGRDLLSWRQRRQFSEVMFVVLILLPADLLKAAVDVFDEEFLVPVGLQVQTAGSSVAVPVVSCYCEASSRHGPTASAIACLSSGQLDSAYSRSLTSVASSLVAAKIFFKRCSDAFFGSDMSNISSTCSGSIRRPLVAKTCPR